MTQELANKKILVMVANGVNESAMSLVQRTLHKCGAVVKTVGMESGLVNSWNGTTWGLYFPLDQQINVTLGADFDCLIVPSGARAMQKLATTPHSERILANFVTAEKPLLMVGDAVTLLEKTGLGGAENKAHVMRCETEEISGHIETLLAQLKEMPEMEKIAA